MLLHSLIRDDNGGKQSSSPALWTPHMTYPPYKEDMFCKPVSRILVNPLLYALCPMSNDNLCGQFGYISIIPKILRTLSHIGQFHE
jgi:hypothetical protein